MCVLLQAMAAHNSGGVVIVQVERIVDRGTMNTRNAHIPGAIVDKIVLAPAENHWMHLGSQHYDGSLSGMAMHHHWYQKSSALPKLDWAPLRCCITDSSCLFVLYIGVFFIRACSITV